MNQIRKNILFVGFKMYELHYPLPNEYSLRYQMRYATEMRYSSTHQGFMLIFNNEYNLPIEELDRKYRTKFNKFDKVLIYNESYSEYSSYGNKWFKVYKVGKDFLKPGFIDDRWNEYKEQKEIVRYNKDKEINLNKLYKYIKKYEKRKTSEISKDLKMSDRSIQRYMHDLNKIYHNIGYDYSLNEWYFPKGS